MFDNEQRRMTDPQGGLTARQEYWLGVLRQHHTQIRRYFVRHVRDPDDAEELMQKVVLDLLVRPGRLRNPRGHLLAIARRELRRYWRCQGSKPRAAWVPAVVPSWWILPLPTGAPPVSMPA